MPRHRRCTSNVGRIAFTIALVAGSSMADEPADPTADGLLTAHNRERAREHKLPLKLAPKLCESAAVHARDMVKHGKLDHTGSDGSTVAERAKRVGYVYVRVGENIAKGQKTIDQVMDSWMKSPGHRANILADFTEMGAARIEDDEGLNYWCVNFGIPMPRLKADVAAAAVIEQVNVARKADGKKTLEAEPALTRGAMALSEAMAAKDSFEVDGDPFKLIGEKTIEGREVRLQMSANVPTAEAAAKELVGDDPKKLDTFREIGVGYAVAKSGTPYWCAIFAKPSRSGRPGIPR